MNKVILISIDGMRPDGLTACGNPFVKTMMEKGSYAMDARTVMPSVTLPCHMSMFHSVPPERHGITTNLYMPQVRPVNGIMEQVKMLGGICAAFYGWEPMRDVWRPDSAKLSFFAQRTLEPDVDNVVTDQAIQCIRKYHPDFVYLYQPDTDDTGHDHGWMSEEYLARLSGAIANVEKVLTEFGGEYTVIVTADHGGHARSHGSDLPEDMTIPVFFFGPAFEGGKALEEVSILDIAPTVAAVMGIPAAPEWEGKARA